MVSKTRRNLLFSAAMTGGVSALATRPTAASPTEGAAFQSLASFGAVPGNGSFDCTQALNEAIARKVNNLHVPRGHWYFLSQPNPITHPMKISGEGFSASYLVRRYAPQSNADGLLTIRSSDCHISRLGIGAGAASAGGAAIALLANESSNPDFSVVEDVYISIEHEYPGTWANAILIDGTGRTSAPIGARSLSLRNCYLFASSDAACTISGGVAVSIRDGGFFPAAGVTARLKITGTPDVCSYYVSVDMGYLGGLSVEHCKYLTVRAAVIAGDISTAASAEDSLVIGHCSGRVENGWTRGVHIDTQSIIMPGPVNGTPPVSGGTPRGSTAARRPQVRASAPQRRSHAALQTSVP